MQGNWKVVLVLYNQLAMVPSWAMGGEGREERGGRRLFGALYCGGG